MSTPEMIPAKQVQLRQDAETRLKAGAAPRTQGWSLGMNALSLIHKLASTPASAPDALKLLHEVQVHQVELDLQHEQIETTARELGEDLTRYRELYEYAPVGYVTLGPRRDVLECNRAAARLLGITQDAACGSLFASLLAPASRPLFLEMLERLRPGGGSEHCEARFAGPGVRRQQQLVASLAPDGRTAHVVMFDLPSVE
jgi:PAS domain S-box-containing protein